MYTNMYLYIFILCVNTRTSRINTNAFFFDVTDFQAPKNPDVGTIRRAALQVVTNQERQKVEKKKHQEERKVAIAKARAKAEERGEDPDMAEQQIRNSR